MISRQTSPSQKLTTLLFSASIALLAATGCHKKANTLPPPSALPPETSAPAPTATLSADPTAIDQGQSVVLNWRTTNASSVSIDGIGTVATNGTQTVSPSTSTNFHLVAKGDGGTTEANVRVTVRVPTVPESGNITETDASADAAFHAAVKDLFFDYDSYDIRQADESSVSAAATYLNAHQDIKVLIAGYCDDRGSAEYNITLGENRANAAKQALTAAGVNASRIRVVSYGKERQFCTEENEACWQQNRRAQFNVDR
jgi:peptidoglycan-associated lipoprotein